jgi:hypothetical protein
MTIKQNVKYHQSHAQVLPTTDHQRNSRALNVQKDVTVMALQNSHAPTVTFVKVKVQDSRVLLARTVMLKGDPIIQSAKTVSLAHTIVFQDRLLVQIVVLLENSTLKK